jgi:hypothetical protein
MTKTTFTETMTITPEQFIEKLNELKMTPEERKLAAEEKLGKQIGEVIANILLLFIFPTIIWAVLTFIFALNIAWVKVFGAYFLFNLVKNIIVKSFKK